MCFENLPIVFDESGRPSLAHGATFDVASMRPRGSIPPPATGGRRRDLHIDPVTRIAGALAFHTEIDVDERVVVDAHSEAVLFRGYELILRGRRPEEAIDISSRACGVCGGVHSACAAMALELAAEIPPPPLAVVARNLAQAAELVYDHCLHLFLLSGPDYSEAMVRRTSPSMWARAERTAAPNASTHGFMTIAELMTALNPLRGAMAAEALEVTRGAREIVSLIFGKYPHPSAVLPAGLATTLDHSTLNQVLARIVRLVDFAKRVATLWDDLVEFIYEAAPRYREVGVGRANLICAGIWDDPASYDARYANADTWGARRLSPPGIVIDGELRTTRLTELNLGTEEFVDHSFYEAWGEDGSRPAPDGAPLSPFHPWNKRTIPRPERRSWKERYSWATAPRWDRQPMESGPLARQWVAAAVEGGVETEFLRAGDGEVQLQLPAGQLPEMTLTWRTPPVVNALERNRARAFHVGYCLMSAYTFLLASFDHLRSGDTDMAVPFEAADGLGIGFWEAGRGALTHYAIIQDGVLANYQILTPSSWMASPRDPWEVPGPYEDGVIGTPLLEETPPDDDEFVGIDVLRVIRSFDPCLPCAVHLHRGEGDVVIRDATSCACGA